MRLGLMLEPTGDRWGVDDLVDQALAAERAGVDICAVTETAAGGPWSSTVLAAALGPRTASVRVLAFLGIGDHPVELAEEVAVADLALGGRLVAALDPTPDPDALDETLAVLLAALAPRPFRHDGRRWTVPVAIEDRPGSEHELVRVTPAPAQLEVPVFVVGATHAPFAAAHGVAPLAADGDSEAAVSAVWATLERTHPAARSRWRRVAVRAVDAEPDGAFDDDALVASLRAERASWGLDTCVVRFLGVEGPDARRSAADRLGRRVRPRLQLASLPSGLEESWRREWEGS